MDEKKYQEKIGFLLGEQYRLELHWKKSIYKHEGVCNLEGAYFSGPVLQQAEEIGADNEMLIDFYKQYYIFAENVYIAKLSWREVTYNSDGTVTLGNAKISHDTELNRVPKLKDDDYLVIDTKGHDVETHARFPTYVTIVVNYEGEAYNFWNQHGSYRKVSN